MATHALRARRREVDLCASGHARPRRFWAMMMMMNEKKTDELSEYTRAER